MYKRKVTTIHANCQPTTPCIMLSWPCPFAMHTTSMLPPIEALPSICPHLSHRIQQVHIDLLSELVEFGFGFLEELIGFLVLFDTLLAVSPDHRRLRMTSHWETSLSLRDILSTFPSCSSSLSSLATFLHSCLEYTGLFCGITYLLFSWCEYLQVGSTSSLFSERLQTSLRSF